MAREQLERVLVDVAQDREGHRTLETVAERLGCTRDSLFRQHADAGALLREKIREADAPKQAPAACCDHQREMARLHHYTEALEREVTRLTLANIALTSRR